MYPISLLAYVIINMYNLDKLLSYFGVRFMVFNVTFNKISFISWRSVLLMEETGENHRPVANL
jgi:hypothetical protein